LLQAAAKRTFDLVVALSLLIVTAPAIVLLALAVKLTSPGPVLFRQVRVGKGGRRFRILKLRTMRLGAESELDENRTLRDVYLRNHFKVPAAVDPRLTPVGRVLRRTSLDELPQLVNVVIGHMSLVGPRPVVPAELALYGDAAELYERVRPGVTGFWQVHGRSAVIGAERIGLDCHYVEHLSLWLDLKILVQTLPAVVRCRGAQ
jgi:lipopolysaccharide/colanic/teichoic acid biosynthesis glycosyltransferase